MRVTTLDGDRGRAHGAAPSPGTSRRPQKGGYPDFMSKEIHEQPRAVADTLLGRRTARRHAGARRAAPDRRRPAARSTRSSSWPAASSYHAGLVAKYAIEHWTRLPTEVDIASEFRYRDPVLDERTLVIGVSQSGETVDTLQAMREARRWGAKVLVVTNVVDSSMAREADGVLYTRAGPEVGVASTKCHLAQIVALELLALNLAQVRGHPGRPPRSPRTARRASGRLPGPGRRRPWPGRARSTRWPTPLAEARDFFFLGRHVGLPGRPRGRAQAEGDLLPAGRGLPGRRAQARADRPHRAGHRGGRRGHPDPPLGEDAGQRGRGRAAGGPPSCWWPTTATRRRRPWPTTCCGSRRSHPLLAPGRRRGAPAAAGLPARPAHGQRRRPAPQPGQDGDGRVTAPGGTARRAGRGRGRRRRRRRRPVPPGPGPPSRHRRPPLHRRPSGPTPRRPATRPSAWPPASPPRRRR